MTKGKDESSCRGGETTRIEDGLPAYDVRKVNTKSAQNGLKSKERKRGAGNQ